MGMLKVPGIKHYTRGINDLKKKINDAIVTTEEAMLQQTEQEIDS